MNEALNGAVKERDMGDREVGWQAICLDRKPVILGSDEDSARCQLLYRMIGAMVAELHFVGARTGCQRENLMAQADAKQGYPRSHRSTRHRNGVVAGLRIARPVL